MLSKTNKIMLSLSLAAIVLAGAIFFVIVTLESYVQPQSSQDEAANEPPEENLPTRAEQVMKALAASYPNIEKVEFRGGDWAVLLRDSWYYYAEGKLLPEELLEKASEYSPSFSAYNYPDELPPWTEPSPEQIARYSSMGRNNNNENVSAPRIQRSVFFLEALWQTGSQNDASRMVRSVKFLGKNITVHSDLVEIISKVQERIITAAKNDPQLQTWIDNIGEIHGWNWRNVAGSQVRSRHSYGIAIDILPKSLGGRATYWQWSENWWNIPYERRYHPPETVIKIFEDHGFIWGGKWVLFDTMHFEYRPEVFILNALYAR